MAKFFIGYSAFATTTGNKTAAKVIGASAVGFEVVEVGMEGAGTVAPADVQHQCNVGFLSNAGAGTAGASPTPERMGQNAGRASGLTAGTAFSAEPTTYATNVFPLFAFNQRGGMRWAVPQGEGFKSDGAQTNLSFGARVISSVAGSVDGNMMWWE